METPTQTRKMMRDKFQEPVQRESVAADWRRRGYSCELFVDPPGREWRDFVHSSNELVTVVEGRLKMTVDGVSCEVGPGDEVFIRRGALHTVENVHSGPTRWLYGYDG